MPALASTAAPAHTEPPAAHLARPSSGRAAQAAVGLLVLVVSLLAGCAGPRGPERTPEVVRAEIVRRLPPQLSDRSGWATDVQMALDHLQIDNGAPSQCAVLAVTEQESTFRADPAVPGLPKIAREEIFKRAERMSIPAFAVRAALQMKDARGRTYDERLDAVRTERELSLMFEDFIDEVPLGSRLLAGYNPVRTGGPMQVGIAFAEAHVQTRPYPYAYDGNLRREVFTRRGGLYFGTAHLLDYAAPYGDQMIYRFADFNAGRYASRNAAFQQALATASGQPLDLDGDLVRHGGPADAVGETERVARSLAPRLGLNEGDLRADLEKGEGPDFDRTATYAKVFALADKRQGRTLPRATLPRIRLDSPKITRKLTTEWFAKRVDERYQRCLSK